MASKQEQDKALPYAQDAGKCAICGKPIIGGKAGDIGKTCQAHAGKIGKYYKPLATMPDPAKYATLVKLCDIAQANGASRYRAVQLTGKDGGTQPPSDPVFTVYTWQGRKYVEQAAITALVKLLTGK